MTTPARTDNKTLKQLCKTTFGSATGEFLDGIPAITLQDLARLHSAADPIDADAQTSLLK